MIRILSIDGGGVRGIVPAVVLAAVEDITGRNTARMFDLIAGTSTGGLLALGLVRPDPIPARDLVALYEREGPRIFFRSRRFPLLANLLGPRYPASGIEDSLSRTFGEARLKDAVTEVIVPAYETERRMPFFFRSSRARTRPDFDFAMKDVARATSAAPTYFEPKKVNAFPPEDYYSLVDGGVYANNPAMCAYAEARQRHPDDAEVFVVSLGTGSLTLPLPYSYIRSWGLIGWARPLLDVVFSGVAGTVDFQLRQLLPAGRYYRFDGTLEPRQEGMDCATADNIRSLKLLGESIVRTREDDLRSVCRLLTA